MKVTIITVTYNSETYLRQCIESVLNQDYQDIEYIVIDGQSSDGTLQIIKEYADRIFKWQSEPDTGIYNAINKGIRLATGDIIGILNSDDFLANNNVISRLIENYRYDESLSAVFADVCFVDSIDTTKIVRRYSSRLFKTWMFKFGFQPAHPTFYLKKEIFEQYGLYREDMKIAGDFELLLRLLYINKIKYKYVNDVWVYMRLGGASTSGINSVINLNKEIIKSFKLNDIRITKLQVYSKYLIKWWGFVFK